MIPGRRSFFQKVALLFSRPWPALGSSSAAAQATVEPRRQEVRAQFDLIVVGGGIAGTCAAISAARNGLRVALVHERSMLGGNSSSEVKLFPENNSGHHPWIKESGIHDEFHVEERTRNHLPYVEGTMNCHWDLVLYEWAVREKNLKLYLNTHMHEAIMENRSRVAGIRAIQLGTEKAFELHAPLFVDATGDGVLAWRAGADFRWGREARSEYNEPLAPEQADERLMGSTLFFRAVDTGRPVPFKKPEWAATFESESDLTSRGHSYIEGGYWWIEVGAPHHPIQDNEEIRHEALRQLLGVWDHIKNRGQHGAENYGLEFAGFWPYKRECRRILGDYVLTQQHVQDPQPLEDAVAYGCWGIDIHVQGGILARREAPYPPPTQPQNWDPLGTQVYGIPLRALYSRNIENLLMAGRPISGSYLAFASSRVLSTGAIVGQAVGAAAAVARKHNLTPRRVASEHIKEVQQLILRQDGHIPGVENEDPNDLARQARAVASSEWPLEFPEPNEARELGNPSAQIFPVSTDRLEHVELLLESKLPQAVPLRVALRKAAHAWDFRATEDLAEARAQVPPGHTGWLAFPLAARLEPGHLYYVYTEARAGLFWQSFKEIDGEPNRCPVGVTPAFLPGRARWRPITMGHSFCLRLTPESRLYAASNVNHGANRPDKWTNIWISDPKRPLPAWIELHWNEPKEFNTVQVTLDTDANRRVTLPLFRYPDCVKDYLIECRTGTGWRKLAEGKDNHFRRAVHRFDPVRSNRLRLNIVATNGAPSARVYEIRVYNEPGQLRNA